MASMGRELFRRQMQMNRVNFTQVRGKKRMIPLLPGWLLYPATPILAGILYWIMPHKVSNVYRVLAVDVEGLNAPDEIQHPPLPKGN